MSDKTYQALVVREEGGHFIRCIESLPLADLPEHDTLIRVHYSSLNYKDALSAHGNRGITRQFPHTPGVDAAGTVEACSSGRFDVGDDVIVTGYDLGMNTAGGLGEYIRVPADWVVPLPDDMTHREVMGWGTAGFTAAQCLYRSQQHGLSVDTGPIVVTGATGGVGSLAVGLFSKAGYEIVACTRQLDQTDWLTSLGASDVISPDELIEDTSKPLLKGRWGGAVDTVAGKGLESILKTTRHRGVVTICGMIAGQELNTSVFPFILRGVALIGIDSAECPIAMKRDIWSRLATDWACPAMDTLIQEISLEGSSAVLEQMISGTAARGRFVVKHQG